MKRSSNRSRIVWASLLLFPLPALFLAHRGAPEIGLHLLPAAALFLGANLILRFLRWHLLLRSVRVYVPERDSFLIYLGSFFLNFTPFYLGPFLYRLYMLRRFQQGRSYYQRIAAVLIAELFYDAAGLLIVAAIGSLVIGNAPALVLAVAALFILMLPQVRQAMAIIYTFAANTVSWLLGKPAMPFSGGTLRKPFSRPRLIYALALSTLAWLAPAAYLSTLLQPSEPAWERLAKAGEAVGIATFGGVASGLPGGSFTTESLLQSSLGSDIEMEQVVAHFRLGTLYLSIVFGAAAAMAHAMLRKRASFGGEHFDTISGVYDAQIPTGVQRRLLRRKTGVMLEQLRRRESSLGLDLGCGQGKYAAALERSGIRVVGIDISRNQLAVAGRRLDAIASAEAERLPFLDESFDYVYTINVIHHLEDRHAQRRAVAEIRRVLKPGGVFFLHEINTANPLFRFYMGYVFPILREIDTGVERWILPGQWQGMGGWRPERVVFYTFLPDFLPEWAAWLLRPAERRLEKSRWRRFSAHYSAVFVKTPDRDET